MSDRYSNAKAFDLFRLGPLRTSQGVTKHGYWNFLDLLQNLQKYSGVGSFNGVTTALFHILNISSLVCHFIIWFSILRATYNVVK